MLQNEGVVLVERDQFNFLRGPPRPKSIESAQSRKRPGDKKERPESQIEEALHKSDPANSSLANEPMNTTIASLLNTSSFRSPIDVCGGGNQNRDDDMCTGHFDSQPGSYFSNAKVRFQSSFMLTTVQPSFFD